jgi:hypothetical protein
MENLLQENFERKHGLSVFALAKMTGGAFHRLIANCTRREGGSSEHQVESWLHIATTG